MAEHNWDTPSIALLTFLALARLAVFLFVGEDSMIGILWIVFGLLAVGFAYWAEHV